jgi:hypothetical protein
MAAAEDKLSLLQQQLEGARRDVTALRSELSEAHASHHLELLSKDSLTIQALKRDNASLREDLWALRAAPSSKLVQQEDGPTALPPRRPAVSEQQQEGEEEEEEEEEEQRSPRRHSPPASSLIKRAVLGMKANKIKEDLLHATGFFAHLSVDDLRLLSREYTTTEAYERGAKV